MAQVAVRPSPGVRARTGTNRWGLQYVIGRQPLQTARGRTSKAAPGYHCVRDPETGNVICYVSSDAGANAVRQALMGNGFKLARR